MQNIAIKGGHHGRPALVQRRHDLSGVDYEHIINVDAGVAAALDDRGVCVWNQDAQSAQGRPAIVLSDGAAGVASIEIRADGADPTTVIAVAQMDAVDARCCVGEGQTPSIDWIHRPVGSA